MENPNISDDDFHTFVSLALEKFEFLEELKSKDGFPVIELSYATRLGVLSISIINRYGLLETIPDVYIEDCELIMTEEQKNKLHLSILSNTPLLKLLDKYASLCKTVLIEPRIEQVFQMGRSSNRYITLNKLEQMS